MTTAVYQIGEYIVDAFVVEEHTAEVEITAFPVEKGSDITDHVRVLPDVLNVEGVVSDTPLAPVATARTEGTTASLEARELLLATLKERELLTIITSTGAYASMMMQSITFLTPDGAACRFRATFKRVEIVTNTRSVQRVAVPRAAKKVQRGKKAVKVDTRIEEWAGDFHMESFAHEGARKASDAINATESIVP